MSGKRGAFICLEGIDHSGKTTQCELLARRLRELGHSVASLRFPDRETHTGRVIDAYLRERAQVDDRAVHLLYSANRWERRAELERQLLAGTTVVVDRYSFSGVAYTAAKGLDPAWCKAPEVGLTAPDVVVFLHLGVREAMERGADKARERYETEAFQTRVAAVYETALVGKGGMPWSTVESDGSAEQTSDRVLSVALAAIESAASAPIRTISW
eukprot:m51a1_g1359 putative protein zeu1 (214) ;mRNA; f:386456-387097